MRRGSIAELRAAAGAIAVDEKGYFKINGLYLNSVPVRYGSSYYYACGNHVGGSGRMCLKELDEDNRSTLCDMANGGRNVLQFMIVFGSIIFYSDVLLFFFDAC